MIELYTWKTPNGRKVPIMLEEIGWAYDVRPVDLGRDEQSEPAFLAIAPNNKIPAIIDRRPQADGLTLFESGAILTYLAEESGQLGGAPGPTRWQVAQWVHWQIGGLGPMLGQLGYFGLHAGEHVPHALERFRKEAARLLDVMERRLADVPYLAGEVYTIADIAAYPWAHETVGTLQPALGPGHVERPKLSAWLDRVGQRPAVQAGMRVLA